MIKEKFGITLGEPTIAEPVNKHIVFFSVMWGDGIIDQYSSCLLRSLWQPDNIPKLMFDNYTVEFYVSCKFSESKLFQEKLSMLPYSHLETFPDESFEMLPALHRCMSYCRSINSWFFMALPDHFYGNGSVYNIVKAGLNRQLCIAGPHLRIDQDKFSSYLKDHPREVLSNKDLAKMVMETMPHENTTLSFVDRQNYSYVSQVMIQQITPSMYTMVHRLPSVCLATFTETDVDYLKDFGCWDHRWPSNLMAENRLKYIGSSEIFFFAEMTIKDSHSCGPATFPIGNDEIEPSPFHKEINRVFMAGIHT